MYYLMQGVLILDVSGFPVHRLALQAYLFTKGRVPIVMIRHTGNSPISYCSLKSSIVMFMSGLGGSKQESENVQ